jgi:hypothetical protein
MNIIRNIRTSLTADIQDSRRQVRKVSQADTIGRAKTPRI